MSTTTDTQPIIDTDIHPQPVSFADIAAYLPREYRELSFGSIGEVGGHRGSGNPHGVDRRDAIPEQGPGGSSWPLMKEQLFDKYNLTYGILTPASGLGACVHPNGEYGAALASAYNQWQAETWWDLDPRIRGSILVAPQRPEKAVEEIRRWSEHPKAVQVLMSSATRVPLGDRDYWPIYKAACDAGLPVAVHPGCEGTGISNTFAAGMPYNYLEWHTNLSQNYMGQITSLVVRGAFCEFPELRFVGLEGGFSWLVHLMWRFDKNWKALRIVAPWLKKAPSEYILDHVYLSSQPMEEPPKQAYLEQIFEMIQAEKILMFSSDYPHWDNDCPIQALSRVKEPLKSRLLYQNAAELYGLSL